MQTKTLKVDKIARLDLFFSDYPVVNFDKNQIIIMSGEKTNYVYQVIRGRVNQFDISKNGDEILIRIFQPPSIFSIFWAISNQPNQYYFQAKTNVKLRKVPISDLKQFLQKNNEIMFPLMEILYIGINNLQTKIAYIAHGNAKNRVIFELVVYAKRFGISKENKTIELEMHEYELANSAGLTRETVNRVLSKLKSAKMIEVNHNKIIINDILSLEAKLEEA